MIFLSCLVFGPMPVIIVQIIYQAPLGGIFHHRLISWQQRINATISPARSQTLILWRVSTSAGSVATALIEKRRARLQGSVFKSIICSPNPTSSSASPSWTELNPDSSPTCKPRLFHLHVYKANYLSFGLELFFIQIFCGDFCILIRIWPNTHSYVVCINGCWKCLLFWSF